MLIVLVVPSLKFPVKSDTYSLHTTKESNTSTQQIIRTSTSWLQHNDFYKQRFPFPHLSDSYTIMPAIYRAHEYLISTVRQTIYVNTHCDQMKTKHSKSKIKHRTRTSLIRNLQLVCFVPALFAALCSTGILRSLFCGTTGSTQRTM